MAKIDLSQRQRGSTLVPTLPPTSIPTQRLKDQTQTHDSLGTSILSTAQVPILSNKATLIVPPRTRAGVELCNLSGIDVFFGPDASVTATSGHLLLGVRGTCKYLETCSAVWGITASGTATLSWAEILD